MFEITGKDIEVFKAVGEYFDDGENLDSVEYVHIKKEIGWYVVTLFYNDGEIITWLKSTSMPIINVKRVKYLSGCKVFVEEGLIKELCDCKKVYHQIGDTNYSRGPEGEFHSF